MKLTLNGALDLSRSINNQSIWNKRSLDYFNKLGKDLKEEAQDRYYDCEFADYAFVDDIATTTGLVVKTLNEDGTDDQTLVLDTDF